MPQPGLARLPYRMLLEDARGAVEQPGLSPLAPSSMEYGGDDEMRSYEPTILDRIGALIAGDGGNPLRRRLARELIGTSGTGRGEGTGIGGSGVSAIDAAMLYGPQAPLAAGANVIDQVQRGNYETAALMAAPAAGGLAAKAIAAAPKAATGAMAGLGLAGTAASAGDPADDYGILKPQLPSEPQPRTELMPDESAMPERYRTNPRLRQKWYSSELEKLKPVNERRAAEDAQRRQEWMTSIQAAQEKYAEALSAAQQAERERQANMTFMERNPNYRYVPLAASAASGVLANILARRAAGTQRAWDAGVNAATGELRGAMAAGNAPRAEQLQANLSAQLASGRPSGAMSPLGYASSAAIAPEFAAAPTIIDYATPGRPREEAKKDMADPMYWAKTYGVPLALGASAAKTGAMLAPKGASAVPGARGAIAEAEALTAQVAKQGPAKLLEKATDALQSKDMALMSAYEKALKAMPDFKTNPEAVGVQRALAATLKGSRQAKAGMRNLPSLSVVKQK